MPTPRNFTFIKTAVHIHRKQLGTVIEIDNGCLRKITAKPDFLTAFAVKKPQFYYIGLLCPPQDGDSDLTASIVAVRSVFPNMPTNETNVLKRKLVV